MGPKQRMQCWIPLVMMMNDDEDEDDDDGAVVDSLLMKYLHHLFGSTFHCCVSVVRRRVL
jgi:hypothetical protein